MENVDYIIIEYDNYVFLILALCHESGLYPITVRIESENGLTSKINFPIHMDNPNIH